MSTLLLLGLLLAQGSDQLVDTIPEGVHAGHFSFSHDGQRVAYGVQKGDQFWVVLGAWKSKPSPRPVLPVLLANGRDVLIAAFKDRAAHILHNETVLFEIPDSIGWWFPGVPTPDAKTVLNYKVDAKTGKCGVAINGKLQALHKGNMAVPVVSPDGKRFAFALEHDDGHCIVENDKPGPTYDWVTQPVLSADGKVLAYGAELDNKHFILHGEKKIPVETPIKGVFMSADGASVGWWGRAKVVVAGREGPAFAAIQPPVFSPDGKHVAYRAQKADKTWSVVVDDLAVDAGDIQVDPVFTADGKVGFGFRKGQQLWWKTLEVK